MNPLAKAIGLLTAATDAHVADLCGAERWVAMQEIERVSKLLRAAAVGAKEGRLALSLVRAEADVHKAEEPEGIIDRLNRGERSP
jgi:hypothetical protein